MVPDEPDLLRHVTQLDVRDNRLTELDASVFPRLEVLHCERNRIASLKAKGGLLKGIYASNNELRQLDVSPVPSNLSYMDISRNRMESLPDWLWEAKKLEVLDMSHNLITELPARLFCSNSLRKLSAGHNQLQRLPERVERPLLEVLDIQHNQLVELPCNLFLKSDSLRSVNASANKLEQLPPSSLSEESHSILQELYLTNNRLTDKCVPLLTGHTHLRVLHMAYNHLQTFPASKMAKLEELEEVDLSGNMLKTVPTTIMNCRRMHTLIAHSNAIEVFPEVMQLMEMKCVDLSCNELSDITLPENLPPKLQELDLTGNPRLNLDHKTLEQLKKLGTAGQKLGGSAVLCHLRHDPTDPAGCFTLTAANVGKCRAVLCRDGKPLALSLLQNVGLEDEYRRVRQHRAIITEDNKVNGVTDSTRIMGYSFLYPSVIPCPYVQTLTLTPQDEFFILGSRGLWDAVSPAEAVEAVRNVPDGLAAAKKLCTLAQGYGCTDSLSAVVVQLSVSEDCCSCCCSEAPQPPASPGSGPYPPSSAAAKQRRSDGSLPVPPPSSCSEISSEISTSEMSSEVGSTASSDEPPQSSLVLLHEGAHHPHQQPHPLQQQQHAAATQPCQYLFPGAELPSARSCCALHPACLAGSFQRQLSSATFSSALSDNGLDSEDEEPIAGVFSNGSRVEVEADVHCLKAESSSSSSSSSSSPQTSLPSSSSQEQTALTLPPTPPTPPPCTPEPPPPEEGLDVEGDGGPERDESWPSLGAGGDGEKPAGKRRANGSVARQEKSHNLIEVAADAPSKKPGGYFTAPAQPDPDDQFIIPPELEEEVKEIMKQHQQKQQKPAGADQPADCYDTPL
ncbi:PH domain leucine-rich repeat-containing protein phosphatase 1 [Liparis tanakae]|uniref:PH domain leucine-rich repeat-containing protein phosphatase 1 n=1 Tax=Liparis tanakae TaxID=230148 RepID=A0A4Z2H9Q4_9TELE|nr:PH domain leucine-rich repeat-containing protein phosphatase 1 [Liparis tanakae]